MEKINYRNLTEIKVSTQEELDAIPDDFKGRIHIVSRKNIIVRKKYHHKVIVEKKTHIKALGNSDIESLDDSTVVACENSIVNAYGNSNVRALDNSTVMAWDYASVEAFKDSIVIANGNSKVTASVHSNVEARENSFVKARGFSYIEAKDNSRVEARDHSTVIAYGNSVIIALDNSNIEAGENSCVDVWNNSSVIATGNAQVMIKQNNVCGEIRVRGNARIVCQPKTINEFMDFYKIKHTKTKAVFYKAVHRTKERDVFASDYNRCFTYTVGKTKKEECDTDTNRGCSYGINISNLRWALNYGATWNDLAIIECETKISDIIIPENSNGKVRTSKIKVLREVPFKECGVYGKMLANSKI